MKDYSVWVKTETRTTKNPLQETGGMEESTMTGSDIVSIVSICATVLVVAIYASAILFLAYLDATKQK